MKYTALAFTILCLFFSACTIKTTTVAGEQSSIGGSYWVLLSLEGQDVQTAKDTRMAYIRFEEGKGEVKGYTGCNNFFGKYTVQGTTLRLSGIGSTRMMCPNIEQENKMLGLLQRIDSYKIADKLLTLYADGQAVATFQSGNPDDVSIETNR
ncbi:META domain-containing protein [Pontibacter vulgaris]|uniref:META domain-containing protein n=1 Tax=Pontibacter vulgaris TaxID=2905679 RepID=UPI001FA7123A|nr:META domain-containing protein [Pontibacter vulgaris]